MTVEVHFWENGVNETGLDRIALLVSEESMVERIGQCWFVVYLKNQIRNMSLHGSIDNSSSHFVHLVFPLVEFESPGAIDI